MESKDVAIIGSHDTHIVNLNQLESRLSAIADASQSYLDKVSSSLNKDIILIPSIDTTQLLSKLPAEVKKIYIALY